MIVTGLSERDKLKIRVEIDGQFAFVLYKGELSRYGVKQGEELSPENYRIITQEILPKRVKLRAMNLLKSRAYTTMQLREKLRAGEYREEFITLAIDYVSSFGYLDDRRYAADFVEYNKESKSKRRIQMDLQKKGISKELFEEVWEETAGDAQKELETEQIKRLMEKKHFCPESASKEEIFKMMGFLYRKGFSTDLIRNVVSLDITSI